MKTIHFNPPLLVFLFFLIFAIDGYSQTPSLEILRNGAKVNTDDRSIKKGDIITVRILNTDSKIQYKISNLNLEIRTQQYQQIKSHEQAKRYHRNITLSTKFETSPEIEVKVNTYMNRYVSRLMFKLISVEQLRNGNVTMVDWITYGKEYEFWYFKY